MDTLTYSPEAKSAEEVDPEFSAATALNAVAAFKAGRDAMERNGQLDDDKKDAKPAKKAVSAFQSSAEMAA